MSSDGRSRSIELVVCTGGVFKKKRKPRNRNMYIPSIHVSDSFWYELRGRSGNVS